MSAWPEGVSDGLVLPCALCGLRPKFDFLVSDDCWETILGNAEYKRGVVCLPCFDRLATEKGHDISLALIEVQFTGIGKTIILRPERVHRYQSPSTGKDTEG